MSPTMFISEEYEDLAADVELRTRRDEPLCGPTSRDRRNRNARFDRGKGGKAKLFNGAHLRRKNRRTW
ncbi:MAG: hypothetical protein KDA42_13510 [Planctomycetales bacterium]|nr:hypothetical protein [Planctomycetales bacterium]